MIKIKMYISLQSSLDKEYTNPPKAKIAFLKKFILKEGVKHFLPEKVIMKLLLSQKLTNKEKKILEKKSQRKDLLTITSRFTSIIILSVLGFKFFLYYSLNNNLYPEMKMISDKNSA